MLRLLGCTTLDLDTNPTAWTVMNFQLLECTAFRLEYIQKVENHNKSGVNALFLFWPNRPSQLLNIFKTKQKFQIYASLFHVPKGKHDIGESHWTDC